MDDLLKVFLAETAECLTECQGDLAKLRQAPDDAGALDNILRVIRSVRETSGFLGMPALQVAADAAIDGLEATRARRPAAAARVVSIAEDSLARIKTVVDGLAGEWAAPKTAAGSAVGIAPAAGAPAAGVLATKRPTRRNRPAADVKAAEFEEDATAIAAPPASPAVTPGEVAGVPVEALPPREKAPHRAPPGAPAPADGTIRVSAEMLENLLSTVSRLMAAQTEMMQMLKAKEPSTTPAPVQAAAEAPSSGSAGPQNLPPGRETAPITTDGKVIPLAPRQAAAARPAPEPAGPAAAGANAASAAPAVETPPSAAPAKPAAASVPTQRILLFGAADGTPRAVVLDPAVRLEEVDVNAIDGTRGLWVMRSAGELFPLVPFDAAYRLAESGRAPVIIFTVDGQGFGLLVDSVQEIADAVVTALPSKQGGRIGTVQVRGATVAVIDPVHYLNEAVRTRFRLGRRSDPKARAPRAERPAIPPGDDLFIRKPGR